MKRLLVASTAIAFVASSLGCGDDSKEVQFAPPEGYPYLSSHYDVTMEIVGGDCLPAGLTPTVQKEIEAYLYQYGENVVWKQSTQDGNWKLQGAVCPVGDGYELRLSGVIINRQKTDMETCEARLSIPTGAKACPEDDPCCETGVTTNFAVDSCLIDGTFESTLAYRKNCASNTPCTLKMHLTAKPTGLYPFAPDGGVSCDESDSE